jgi:ligand-binding sensor domain-containing protein/signal transduction histidine kinase
LNRYWLYIFLVLFFSQQLYSQPPVRFAFTHYGIAAGLAANEVMDIVQDREGYIWIATTNGLQRYDGVRFKTFHARKNDPTSLPANYVHQLLFDKNNNLWIQAGGERVGIFDTKNFTFKEVVIKPSNELQIKSEKKIVKDEEGNVFLIIWNTELLTYNEKNNEFSTANNFMRLPADWKIIDIYQLPGTKKYIIGTSKNIAVYNRQTGQLNYTGHNIEKLPLVDKLGTKEGSVNFLLDKRDRLWFDTWEGGAGAVYSYDTRSDKIVLDRYSLMPLIKKYHELRGFLQQRNGNIWIKGLGVFGHYQENEKQFQLIFNGYENDQSIAFSRVSALFEDHEHNIWVATDNNGLYRFNPQEQYFTNIRPANRMSGNPGDGGFMSFVRTKQGTVLAGAWGDGLFQYDSNYNMIPLNFRGLSEKSTPSMWSMYASKDSNTIWVGAQPGIWVLNQATRSATSHNPAIMKERTVRQVAEDKYGNLWMGTQSIGLFKWNAEKGKKKFDDGVSLFNDIPQGQVTKITIDNKGFLWVGTTATGLYVIDPTTDKVVLHLGTKEAEERKLLSDGIAAALQYDDTTMIIAANSISVFNTKQQKITQTIALPDIFAGVIASIEKDQQGYLWVSASSGIFRVNIKNKIFIHFDRADGIANDHFVIAASYALPDGKILFGADNQFVVFNPSEVKINDFSPDIKITGFKLANESLRIDSLLKKERIELSPEDNSIAIEFSGLSYNTAYIIRYKLEGLEKEWKVADGNYQAIYSYLPPGTYTFLARSEDAEGVAGSNITRLVIHVNPPFWKTWWFFCLLALVIAAIFYWLDKQRVNKLLALQKVRTDIAANLHEEVNTTLNNINLLSEMARIKADKDINRSKEYIDQISTDSHNMIIAMDDILWSIDPQNDSMEKSLLRMMEFSDALKNRYGAGIELALDKKVRSLKLDMKTRHEVFFIFKEALRLIVQYSGGRETLIHIDLFKNNLSLKLQDPGASLEKNVTAIDKSIKEMNDRAVLIHAELDVQCDRKGIAIILLVPVK